MAFDCQLCYISLETSLSHTQSLDAFVQEFAFLDVHICPGVDESPYVPYYEKWLFMNQFICYAPSFFLTIPSLHQERTPVLEYKQQCVNGDLLSESEVEELRPKLIITVNDYGVNKTSQSPEISGVTK